MNDRDFALVDFVFIPQGKRKIFFPMLHLIKTKVLNTFLWQWFSFELCVMFIFSQGVPLILDLTASHHYCLMDVTWPLYTCFLSTRAALHTFLSSFCRTCVSGNMGMRWKKMFLSWAIDIFGNITILILRASCSVRWRNTRRWDFCSRKCQDGKYQYFSIDLPDVHLTVRQWELKQKANSHPVGADIKTGKCAKINVQNLART